MSRSLDSDSAAYISDARVSQKFGKYISNKVVIA